MANIKTFFTTILKKVIDKLVRYAILDTVQLPLDFLISVPRELKP